MPFGFNYQDPRAALTVDPSPNATAPAEDRIFRSPVSSGVRGRRAFEAIVLLVDGTSLDVTLWVRLFHRTGPTWVQLAATTSVTKLEAARILNVPPGADLFLQVTSPAGSPTVLGVMFSAAEVGIREFAPTSLTGCKYWLPYDRGLTVTSDVKRWLDRSGLWFHVEQDVAANRPVQSGTALRFTASGNEHLDRNAIGALGNGYTVGMALQMRSLTGVDQYLFHNGTAANGFQLTIDVANDRRHVHPSVASIAWGAATLNAETWVFRHTGATALADFALNGAHQTQQALANNVAPTGGLSIGAFNSGAIPSDADVWAVIAYSDRKSDAVVANINAYLTALRDGTPLPAWRPTDETNLLLWLEQPEYYAGPAVSAWANQGTAGGSVVQAAAASMPVLLQRSFAKNWPCVHFDGVDDFMEDSVLSEAQPNHIFASALITESDTFLATHFDGSHPNFRSMFEGGANVRIYAGTSLSLTETGNAWHRWEALFNGASSKLAADEGAPATGDAGVGGATGLSLGRRASDGNYGDCIISEWTMFDRVLPADEIAKMNAYMVGRFP